MSLPAGTQWIGGIACTPDGAVYVEPTGTASLTGGSGFPVLLAQSFTAVTTAADTVENTAATITIAAGTLGAGGVILLKTYWTVTNNANVKTARIRWSGGAGTDILTGSGRNFASAATWVTDSVLGNSAAAVQFVSTQVFTNNAALGPTHSAHAVDTAAATTLVITMQKATGADVTTLNGYTAWYVKAA